MHLISNPKAPIKEKISFNDFLNIDIRIGEIVEAQTFELARNPSFKLKIDFGESVGIKKSSAQITFHYTSDELIGKKVAAVVNFAPRQIGKFMSEVLVLGFADKDSHIVLFDLDKNVPNGAMLL